MLNLLYCRENTFEIELETRKDDGEIVVVHLSGTHTSSKNSEPIPNALTNVKQALKCAVVAIEGERSIFQTRSISSSKAVGSSENRLSVHFHKVLRTGDIDNECTEMHNDIRILSINGNLRMTLLKKHVENSTSQQLVVAPAKQLIGACRSVPLLDEISHPPPTTLSDLNDDQKRVARPLLVKTCIEVAGPPGTGKSHNLTD